jgi:5'-phosphate synthase pdxT subunit
MMMAPQVGVLALQGDFHAHARMLKEAGAETREVRKPADLAGLRGLVIPGGESSALLKLMEKTGFEAALTAFHREGGALFGTCAGMILLARDVSSPSQRSLGLIDLDVERNAYGRQIDSFEAEADWTAPELNGAGERPLPLVFIRAPRLTRRGENVVPLARCRDEVVLAREERVMVSSYHPEISEDLRVHRYFLGMVGLAGDVEHGP